ncbi:MAG TPA: DUF2062 domain-containing protein [Gammaproteobacteria bacterium]|nr:DUF2062 domain-containing protein [Gammaproteobacteria bacterium]
MPRKFLKKLMPDRHALHARLHGAWYMRPFQALLHDPALWHINRRGSCGALALGLFICCLPVPGHMLLAVLGALFWRFNLPIAVVSVWANNPLTFGPIYYLGYKIGTLILQLSPHPFPAHMSFHWILAEFRHIWEPLWLGSVLLGMVFAFAGYAALRFTWYVSIRGRWLRRRHARARKSDS